MKKIDFPMIAIILKSNFEKFSKKSESFSSSGPYKKKVFFNQLDIDDEVYSKFIHEEPLLLETLTSHLSLLPLSPISFVSILGN